MTLNAKLAYEVLDYIEAHPEKHDQATYFNSCGTTACFAGWASLLSGDEHTFDATHSMVTAYVRTPDGRICHIESRAMELLGLEYDDLTTGLFYAARNLDEVRIAVERIFGPRPVAVLESAR